MANLKREFGRLVAAHRHRSGLTQYSLAERAGISVDMVAKIETGATGVAFPTIERLAQALEVHPAELFTTETLVGAVRRKALTDITTSLAPLSDDELHWLRGIIEAALRRRP